MLGVLCRKRVDQEITQKYGQGIKVHLLWVETVRWSSGVEAQLLFYVCVVMTKYIYMPEVSDTRLSPFLISRRHLFHNSVFTRYIFFKPNKEINF